MKQQHVRGGTAAGDELVRAVIISHPGDANATSISRKYLQGENGSPHPPTLRLTPVYPGRALIPCTPGGTPAGTGFVLHGPRGAGSRGWRPSRAGPSSHGQLLRSRRVSEGKT